RGRRRGRRSGAAPGSAGAHADQDGDHVVEPDHGVEVLAARHLREMDDGVGDLHHLAADLDAPTRQDHAHLLALLLREHALDGVAVADLQARLLSDGRRGRPQAERGHEHRDRTRSQADGSPDGARAARGRGGHHRPMGPAYRNTRWRITVFSTARMIAARKAGPKLSTWNPGTMLEARRSMKALMTNRNSPKVM